MTTAKNIRDRREALNISQADLAGLAGCKQQDVARIENGKSKNSKYLAQIVAALDQAESGSAPDRPVSASSAGIAPNEIQAAFEVLFRRMSKTDKAAQWAAETVLQALQSREPPPYGMDRESRVRSVVHDIASGISSKEH